MRPSGGIGYTRQHSGVNLPGLYAFHTLGLMDDDQVRQSAKTDFSPAVVRSVTMSSLSGIIDQQNLLMETDMSAIDGNFVYQKTLSCGRIEVSSEETDYPLTDLFDIAERRNPKRAFLFVSKVLGRHIPVSPLVMRNVYTQLAEKFPGTLDGPVVLSGWLRRLSASGRECLMRCASITLTVFI